jgi:hypothetical protein
MEPEQTPPSLQRTLHLPALPGAVRRAVSIEIRGLAVLHGAASQLVICQTAKGKDTIGREGMFEICSTSTAHFFAEEQNLIPAGVRPWNCAQEAGAVWRCVGLYCIKENANVAARNSLSCSALH